MSTSSPPGPTIKALEREREKGRGTQAHTHGKGRGQQARQAGRQGGTGRQAGSKGGGGGAGDTIRELMKHQLHKCSDLAMHDSFDI